jgi:hypothetical protein
MIIRQLKIFYSNEANEAQLTLDPYLYHTNLQKVVYHEFAHVIDQIDETFGITEDSRQAALASQPEGITNAGFSLYWIIWDCYIGGRLCKHRPNPYSLQERIEELHELTAHYGYFTTDVNNILKGAWDRQNLTFSEVLHLVRQCSIYWQPYDKD